MDFFKELLKRVIEHEKNSQKNNLRNWKNKIQNARKNRLKNAKQKYGTKPYKITLHKSPQKLKSEKPQIILPYSKNKEQILIKNAAQIIEKNAE